MEFISETKAKIRLATLLKWHERVEEQKQKPKKQEKGFISRQMEYYAWKHRAYIESLSISQENQDHGKITRYMKSQDNQLPWKMKKSKDDAIKRWVISQEKYVPLRSNEMPSYVTLDKSQSEDEAQESHSETSSFGDYINISSKSCVRKLSDLKLGDFKFGDLKLGGDQRYFSQ
ncbi:GL20344 [Drosophila persimilis]|uniref:GL20344 n=1 Tax=Drosophila persimilis TaxID=7234 RepID=B4GXS6_DROPE|nr:uncharacterized protein LOC6598380 [Drosophila persimilis]EDW27553.1 GL20344 [Drosophila persimilis]